MACPHDDVLRAAAGGGTPSPELADHLEGCASCSVRLHSLISGAHAPSGELTSTVGGPAPRAPAPQLVRGQTLGRYVVLEKLGEGGMGAVYAAHDAELDRKVALKVLTAETDSEGAGRAQARLLREAQTLAKLAHPNVVGLHDVISLDSRVVVVMELVQGVTLRAWLNERRRSWREVISAFQAAGQGLIAAHEKGLIHRDFKPENVLVGSDGRIRVADFGIARSLDDGAAPDPQTEPTQPETPHVRSSPITRAGTVVGTPSYIAPEVILGRRADARSDQFSFAVSLYEALLGQRPFTGSSHYDRAQNVLAGRFTPLPEKARLPSWLMKVLQRGLAGEPEARFASLAQLLAALEKDPMTRWRRAGLGAAAAACALAVAGLAARASRERANLCTGADERLAPMLAKREQMQRAFLATGTAFSQDAWKGADAALQHLGAQWAQMHRDACLATRVRGEQSDELLSLRMACLDERLREVNALADMFTRADAKTVEKSAKALDALPRVEDCGNVALLLARVKPPASPQVRAAVEALRAPLAEVRALTSLGKYKDGLEKVRPLVEQAKALPYPPVHAETQLWQARLLELTGENQRALELARAAMTTALSAGDDQVGMRGAYELSTIYAHLGSAAPSREWAQVTGALVQRAGGDPELEVMSRKLVGDVEFDLEGNAIAALETFGSALALARKKLGEDHSATFATRDAYAIALMQVGRNSEATQEIQSLIAAMARKLGPTHPLLANPHNVLGNGLFYEGRLAEAREAFLKAQSLLRLISAANLLDAYVEDGLAGVALVERDLPEAQAHYERALAVLDKVSGPDYPMRFAMRARLARVHAQRQDRARALGELQALKLEVDKMPDATNDGTVQTYLALAQVLTDDRQPDKARALLMPLLERLIKTSGADGSGAVETHGALGRVALSRGAFEEAVGHYQLNAAGLEKLGGPKHPDLAAALTGLGEALVGLGRLAEARPVLERAVTSWEARKGLNPERADARFALARSLKAEDPKRAEQLAELAKAEYAQLPDAGARRKQLEGFVAALNR